MTDSYKVGYSVDALEPKRGYTDICRKLQGMSNELFSPNAVKSLSK